MKLLKTYEKFLAAMDNYVDTETSNIYSDRSGKPETMTVSFSSPGAESAKPLPVVMPTKAIMDKGEDFSNIKFNPMAESYMSRNQSEIQKRLVHDASAAVMLRLVKIITALAYTAVDKEAHEDLDPKLFSILRGIKPPKDTKGAERVTKYVLAVLSKHKGIKGPNAICRYQQKVNVKVGDQVYIRATSLITPFLQKLTGEKPYGVNVPNQLAGNVLRTIATNLMKELDIVSTWNGREAPFLMSLLEAHNEVVSRIEAIAKPLGVDLGPNFVAGFFNEKVEKELPKLYEKELKIRFPGNEGTTADDPSQGIVVEETPTTQSPVRPAEDYVPKNTVVATPATTTAPTAQPQEEQASMKPIDLEKRPMAIHSRNDVNPADAQAPAYTSGFAGKASATVSSPAPAAVAPTQHQQPAQSSGLTIEQPAQHKSGLVVEEELVHLHDARNNPLYRRNGQPYMVSPADANEANMAKLLQATDQTTGALKFDGNGAPILRKAQIAGGQPGQPNGLIPAANFYNNNGQPTMPPAGANASSFYQTMDRNRPTNFGHSTALATGVPMNTYNQPPQQIILQDTYRNQVVAQFDANGNAMGQYFTSSGYQITHISQLQNMQPAGGNGLVPQQPNQPVSNFNFGSNPNYHY